MEKHRNGKNTKLGTTFNDVAQSGFQPLAESFKGEGGTRV